MVYRGINSKGGTHKMASLYTAGALAGKTILSAEIGYYHGAVLTTDGKVYTFGANSIAAGSSKL
jgi:alpha-tubulin suppressor-like RCC1 family protein